MTTYEIARFAGDWQALPAAAVDAYPWGGAYRPICAARLAYTDDALLWRMEAAERTSHIRAENRGLCAAAFEDSCMEMFLQPMPDTDARYLNFEVTPTGAHLVAVGEGRGGRRYFTAAELADFAITPFKQAEAGGNLTRWGFTARLGVSFMQAVFPDFTLSPGRILRGNFLKCGDLTPEPHYGMWSPGTAATPDFHQPGDFGRFVLS